MIAMGEQKPNANCHSVQNKLPLIKSENSRYSYPVTYYFLINNHKTHFNVDIYKARSCDTTMFWFTALTQGISILTSKTFLGMQCLWLSVVSKNCGEQTNSYVTFSSVLQANHDLFLKATIQ